MLNAIEHCSKSGLNSYVRHNTLELKTLYEKMTTEVKREKDISLSKALEELDLTCDKDAMKHSTYRAQAMVRLFRKMKCMGMKVAGVLFMQNVCAKDYCYIVGKSYFPELQEKMRKKEHAKINDCMKDMGVECKVVKSVIKMRTDLADWAFSLGENGTELAYFTHQYFKGLRKTKISWERDTTIEERLELVFNEVKRIENNFQYGVGNAKITELVEELSK